MGLEAEIAKGKKLRRQLTLQLLEGSIAHCKEADKLLRAAEVVSGADTNARYQNRARAVRARSRRAGRGR
jgi:hypothetical protein